MESNAGPRPPVGSMAVFFRSRPEYEFWAFVAAALFLMAVCMLVSRAAFELGRWTRRRKAPH